MDNRTIIAGILAGILSAGTILLYALNNHDGAVAVGALNGMLITFLLGLHSEPVRPAE